MSFLDNLKKAAGNLVDKASQDSKDFVFNAIPMNLEELKARPEADQQDPFGVAALTVIALNIYPANPEESYKMLEFLLGPTGFSGFDKSFIKDRFAQNGDSTPRSYFHGTSPANSYEPSEPYTITVKTTPHSNDMGEGYITLYLQSSGADSIRPISFHKQGSTGKWFIHADSWKGLLAGIRKPANEDPWA